MMRIKIVVYSFLKCLINTIGEKHFRDYENIGGLA